MRLLSKLRPFGPLALVLCLPMLLTSYVRAQNAGKEKTVRHIPDDTVAIVSTWPTQLSNKEAMRLAPLEVLTAAGLEQVGLDPLKIERLDILVGFPGPAGPQAGALVQLTEPMNIEQLNPQLLDGQGLKQDGDLHYLQIKGGDFVIYQVDPQTVVVGSKIFVKRMLAQPPKPGKISSLVGQIKAPQDLLAVVSVATLQPMILGILDRPMRDLPPQIAQDLTAIIAGTDFLALGLSLGDPERLQVIISGKDASGADAIEQGIQRTLQFVQDSFLGESKRQFTSDTPTGLASTKYLDRISEAIVGMLTPRRSGNVLVLEVDKFQNISLVGSLTGLLLPAIQSARQAADQAKSSNKLKQIALAFHNFHNAYGTFPATAGLDDKGKPMLSWRVAMLPFVQQQQLYEKFHLDEAWDSEHNIKLLTEMPDVYRSPDRNTQPGYTVYQAPVSDKSLLRVTEPTKMAQITDGTSNTIMVLETAVEAAVPWTAPRDYEIDEERPSKSLFTNGMTNAAFADGSVRRLTETIDLKILRALFTRAGGEVVGRF